MIKAQDLRIGNIVSYRGELFEVFDLICKSSVELDSEKLDRHVNNADLNNIFPVDISEEILLKVGFEKNRQEWSFESFCLQIFQGWLHYSAGEGLKLSNEIKRLHQLQNLYFALTGQELNRAGLV